MSYLTRLFYCKQTILLVLLSGHKKKLKEIGLRIRKLREQDGISRAQLAFEINTSAKQLARIEYGELNTGIVGLIKIAESLNVNIQRVFLVFYLF